MLTQLEADAWFLEDPHGVIRLDLSAAVTTAGFFTEHAFVIVEGTLHASDGGGGGGGAGGGRGGRTGGADAMMMADGGEPPPADTVADPIAGTRVLRVRCMGAPPPEERAAAQAALGPGVDGHGGGDGVHVIKTAVDQAHLWPGAAAAGRGVLWTADTGLGLHPAPDVLVLGDAAAPAYRGHYMGTWGVNAGSFGADRSFAVVLPAEGVVQQ
ncbi:hypothetical protein I4F81_002469 [Pyropia yezoensis]|uniref:Uncharacterized protein n=1 Tax=Pyropia yezoensis TaxID=2788 RepID=A0ACC3BPS2_PYRYE|nr:hypothetical protein I4F81_002469 [Neopyropia yezoensis]